MHTYIHTYIDTYTHTYIHTYIHLLTITKGLKTFEKGLNELSSSNDKYFNKVLSALKQGDK